MNFKTLLEIVTISDMVFDPVWASGYHKSMSCELLHVVKGEVELTYQDGSSYLAGPGDTLLNEAGLMHKDVFDVEEELQIFFISFNWKHSEEFFSKVNNTTIAELSSETKLEISKVFDAMRLDSGSGDIDKVVAESRLMTVLLLLYRDISSPDSSEALPTTQNSRKRLVTKAKEYIDRRYSSPLRLEDIASHLQVSPFYLSRVFSNESDFSFIEYLTETRLNAAKKLLREGRYIVADIARMVGYEDSNYFSKVFKRKTGSSPSKYH